MEQSYEALVRRARDRRLSAEERHAAFDELMTRFQGSAERWAYRVLGDSEAARDAAQEAFITAYRQIDQLHDPAAFPGWLRQITLSRVSRATRRRDYQTPPLREDAPDADQVRQVNERELRELVLDAVRRLPDHERAVTELFYIDGYSQQEIAEQLAVPLTTVKKRLQYAREHLRESLPNVPTAMLFAGGSLLRGGFDTPEVAGAMGFVPLMVIG